MSSFNSMELRSCWTSGFDIKSFSNLIISAVMEFRRAFLGAYYERRLLFTTKGLRIGTSSSSMLSWSRPSLSLSPESDDDDENWKELEESFYLLDLTSAALDCRCSWSFVDLIWFPVEPNSCVPVYSPSSSSSVIGPKPYTLIFRVWIFLSMLIYRGDETPLSATFFSRSFKTSTLWLAIIFYEELFRC